MRKYIILLTIFCLLLCSFVVAANTNDTEWSFYNQQYEGSTNARQKLNLTNVYVYPKQGNNLKYTVQKQSISATGVTYVSARSEGYATIPVGTKATLRNTAAQSNVVRVHMRNSVYNYGYTTGDWSPDSTAYYTVY